MTRLRLALRALLLAELVIAALFGPPVLLLWPLADPLGRFFLALVGLFGWLVAGPLVAFDPTSDGPTGGIYRHLVRAHEERQEQLRQLLAEHAP